MFLERKTPQDTYFESAWSFLSQKSYLWHPVFQNHSIFNLFELLCSLIEVGNLQLLLGLTSTNSSYWTGLLGSLCGILMDLSYNEYLFFTIQMFQRVCTWYLLRQSLYRLYLSVTAVSIVLIQLTSRLLEHWLTDSSQYHLLWLHTASMAVSQMLLLRLLNA